MRPGHNWILKFGNVAGSMSCVEKKFKLVTHKYEEYKDLRFMDGDFVFVVDVWIHRVDEDVSGLTFQEWDPSLDTDVSQASVTMIVNSSELLQLRPTRFTTWVPRGMYCPWITTMSSGHDVSDSPQKLYWVEHHTY